jgi:hypothetical protein
MLDDCMTTQISLSVAGSESTHTKRLLTGISFFDFKNAGDHTPISPFTIRGKDFHLKCYESVYDPHQHSRNCAIWRPTFAIPLPASYWLAVHTAAAALAEIISKRPSCSADGVERQADEPAHPQGRISAWEWFS